MFALFLNLMVLVPIDMDSKFVYNVLVLPVVPILTVRAWVSQHQEQAGCCMATVYRVADVQSRTVRDTRRAG